MSLSYSVKSQTTTKVVTNDSLVCFTKDIADSILHTQHAKDALAQENKLLKLDTTTLLKLINQYKKDSVTQSKKDQVLIQLKADYNKVIGNYDATISNLDKKLFWSKFKTTSTELVLLTSIIYIIIHK